MDHEAIGWAGLEIIRNFGGDIVRIEHIPATRIRVLDAWRGFIEIRCQDSNEYTFYQVFGDKYKVEEDNPFVPGEKVLVPYDPKKHKPSQKVANFVDRDTGEPTEDISKAANEILYFPRHHSNTVYYGYSDSISAVGAIIANSYIKDYQHQFWEHNTIPRYAVIIKGAKVDDDFMKMVSEYFQSHVKGANHKTLIMALGAQAGRNIEVEFKALDVQNKEADFLKTRESNAQQIMTAHGVSPAILGIVNASELGSGKGLSQAEIYKDRVVTPLQEYWAEKLNYLFSQGLGVIFAKLKFDPLDIRDRLNEMTVLTGYSDRGAMTINEVRRQANLGPPLPGGDVAFIRVREGSFFKLEDLPEMASSASLSDSPQNTTGNTPSSDQTGSQTDQGTDQNTSA
jgi:capsid portal protein